jgi:hypothetical protein
MKVKIIKSSSNWWYRNYEGKEFDVYDAGKRYELARDYRKKGLRKTYIGLRNAIAKLSTTLYQNTTSTCQQKSSVVT